MVSLDKIKKGIIVTSGSIAIIAAALWLGTSIYQPPAKTDELYTSGLKSYQNKEYSKSYYLFSKIVFSSKLKPLAIYRQGISADAIEDYKAAIKQYKFFLLLYPKHVLSIRVRYNLAQDLIRTNPEKAYKHFNYIINNYPNSDYAIASEYFTGNIDFNKYKNEKIFPLSVKNDIQNHFRHYLKKAPSGRLAMDVVNDWLSLGLDISKDDYLLMSKTCYLFNDYKKSSELAKKADLKNSWAQEVQTAVATGDISHAKYLIEWGLQNNSEYVAKEDIYKAIDSYMTQVPSKYQAASNLFGIAKSRGKDYLLDIKCKYGPNESKFECYRNLYLWYPSSDFTDEAQSQMFLYLVKNNNIQDAQRIGIDFLNKYKDTSPYAPQVMFYMGRASENARSYRDYISYYRGVISKYPDSYYAYRSYLRLNHSRNPIISTRIKESNIEFPYDRRHGFLDKLLLLGDYEILNEYTSYDDFVRSWTLYKQGKISEAMLVARKAMEKLEEKPDRSDLRWRLVYPVYYYSEIKDYADRAGNVAPLILALTREESYFNPSAQSSVGAKGLMQLMPATAAGEAKQRGLGSYDLFNPNNNLYLGNYHYGQVRTQLQGNDVYAVAAYNSGVGAVNRWLQTINTEDVDVFTEYIPYPETQTYVKKVFRSYWNYIRIYDGNR